MASGCPHLNGRRRRPCGGIEAMGSKKTRKTPKTIGEYLLPLRFLDPTIIVGMVSTNPSCTFLLFVS
jgi:hypothetical protein